MTDKKDTAIIKSDMRTSIPTTEVIKPKSKIKFKYLDKELVCKNLPDNKQCSYAIVFRFGFLLSIIITIVSAIVWMSIFLSGGFEYNDSLILASGIFILINLVAFICIIIFGIALLIRKFSLITLIIIIILLVAIIIIVLATQGGWFA